MNILHPAASKSSTPESGQISFSPSFLESAHKEVDGILHDLKTQVTGLGNEEARSRLKLYGLNELASEQRLTWPFRLFNNFRDPLSILLLTLGIISYFTGDIKVTALIAMMLMLSVGLRFFQETRADAAAEKLKAMVHITATVRRGGVVKEVPLKFLVTGDIVYLAAGDMVPADIRLIESRDLFINQATLTGEALPVEKHSSLMTRAKTSPMEMANLCFMGTDVETGTATGVVISTGHQTYFGSLAKAVSSERELTSFDKGISSFTWLMIRFIVVMVPLVFFINGLGRGNWVEAFLFALAVAVGLTPELLPMIVTVNLSKGALDMSRHKVIVKRLNAIQNFGAMNILCTDKTGTLTQGKVVLIKHIDINGHENAAVLEYAYLNSYYQTGLKNLLDVAVLKHDVAAGKSLEKNYKKIDEVPFDFVRRRMSVVVEDQKGRHLLICKGAVEEVLQCSSHVKVGDKVLPLSEMHHQSRRDLVTKLNNDGFRLIALAVKDLPSSKTVYRVADETNLTLIGFLAFLDPPKDSAARAVKELQEYGVQVKVLTGDNELVARKICGDVGLSITGVLKGGEVQDMSDSELGEAAERATIFDKFEPAHKERVIRALQRRGHVVGYLGDGINDAPALKAADVGISVDMAVDIAKESSDIILLEKSLLVLKDGVREGRKIFGNIIKYIQMTASSNFGNMLSVVGVSIFLPFLPMLPLQVLVNNLLYDFSQAAIPTDSVDDEYLIKPRQWQIKHLERFILFLGPVSSLFDYATYFLMLFIFNAWTNPALFRTGWFVESLLSQTLIIHIIRTNKIPFVQSRASWPLIWATVIIAAVGVWLPFSPLASSLGFVPLPSSFWLYVMAMLLTYFWLTQVVKKLFIKRYGWE